MEEQVLVFTGSPRESALACRVLASAGIAASAASDRKELGTRLDEGIGALLLVEETLADGVLDALTQHIATQPAWSDLPILLMTRRSAESPELQLVFERLGNVTLLERPVRTMTLVSTARSALRGRRRQYEVRALNQRKDQMLATLAHELRNPLAPIRNVAEVLRRRYPAPEMGKLLSIVDRQLSHLTRLVDDLLDVARINSGKLELRRGHTSTADVVQNAVEIASDAIVARSHRLSVEQPEAAVLLADHVRLVQSVANLLVNAAKFTEPGGEIRLRVRTQGEVAEFAVSDNGRGIAREELDAIFAMFRQSRLPGEPSTGLGLGLHLTRAFAELHGGSVRAHSAGLGQGSEFTVSLPIVIRPQSAAEAGPQPESHPPPQKVLVVDDNVDAASTLETVLSLAGLQVAVAHDGAEAVQHVCREAVDAVVMDIGMPVMNGYDAAREMRRLLHDRKPLLIALTGWGQYADKALAADAGFDFHFVKPLVIEDLLACLSEPRAQTAGCGGVPG